MAWLERRATCRAILAVLSLSALSVGIPATLTPHGFFSHWPYFAHWVAAMPPYNEHLTTDVGEFQLAFGLVFAWAAWRPARALVVPLCLAWSLSQILHTIFHAGHLMSLSSVDRVLELAGLAMVSLLPLLAAGLSWRGSSVGMDEASSRRV